MTIDAWYSNRQGQSLLVPGEPEENRGQCVQAVDYALNEVYGLTYHYGNAIDWWNNPGELLNNFDKVPLSVDYPKTGDFVVWDEGVGSVYGHIDVAAQDGDAKGFLGYDSNWGRDKTLHTVQHSYQYVIGSLRWKGGGMADTIEVLQSALNDARNRALVFESALYAERAKTADLESKLQQQQGQGVTKDAVIAYIQQKLQ